MRPLLLALILLALSLFAAERSRANPQSDPDAANTSPGINGRYLLMDTTGHAVSNEDFSGRLQLITFGYTSCPDVCPTTLAEMVVVLSKLGKDSEHLQALFITIDPERDTAELLRTYVAFFDPRIIGLTGSSALVQGAADNFKVRIEKVREPGAAVGQYAVDHSAGMYLLGPDGHYIRKFAYAMPPAEIAEWLLAIINSGEFAAYAKASRRSDARLPPGGVSPSRRYLP